MIDRPDSDSMPRDAEGAGVDPDAHPAHVEEWRSDSLPPSDVDEEAVVDEDVARAVPTDRGDTIIVPDEDRPVDLSDDGLSDDDPAENGIGGDEFATSASLEDGFIDEQ